LISEPITTGDPEHWGVHPSRKNPVVFPQRPLGCGESLGSVADDIAIPNLKRELRRIFGNAPSEAVCSARIESQQDLHRQELLWPNLVDRAGAALTTS
jgi:hypothetical protein